MRVLEEVRNGGKIVMLMMLSFFMAGSGLMCVGVGVNPISSLDSPPPGGDPAPPSHPSNLASFPSPCLEFSPAGSVHRKKRVLLVGGFSKQITVVVWYRCTFCGVCRNFRPAPPPLTSLSKLFPGSISDSERYGQEDFAPSPTVFYATRPKQKSHHLNPQEHVQPGKNGKYIYRILFQTRTRLRHIRAHHVDALYQ